MAYVQRLQCHLRVQMEMAGVERKTLWWHAGQAAKSSAELSRQYLPQATLSRAECGDEQSHDFSQQYTHFIRILSNSLLVVAIYDIFNGTGTSLMCMLAQVLHAYWLLSFYA